jgi:hypothetical protein
LLGAINFLDENIKSSQDDKIRTCLNPFIEDVRQCILGKCPTGETNVPKTIEFQFTYKPLELSYIKPNEVFFAAQFSTGNRLLVLQNNGYYIENIEYPGGGKSIVAQIAPVVIDGNKNAANTIYFVLNRSDATDYSSNKYTQYDCIAGEGCIHNPASPLWFDWAQPSAKVVSLGLIPRAYAAPEENFWSIPDLTALNDKNSERTVGYTHFSVKSSKPLNIDADSFFYDIKANGVAANINGMTGPFRTLKYDSVKPLDIEFGLQNLSFSGEAGGCDTIELTIRFLKDGKLLDKPLILTRPYIALRNAGKTLFNIDDAEISWAGEYVRAGKEYDNEVFFMSNFISKNIDFENNKEKMKAAVNELEGIKNKFNNLSLTFNGQPLVAVLRPPLNDLSYGLVAGVLEKNKQIRFTFEKQTAKELKLFLISLRGNNTSAKPLIDPGSFIYPIKGNGSDYPSPQACIARKAI